MSVDYLLLCAICNEQLELIETLFSIAITLSSVYRTDHDAVVVPKPLQVCIHCNIFAKVFLQRFKALLLISGSLPLNYSSSQLPVPPFCLILAS